MNYPRFVIFRKDDGCCYFHLYSEKRKLLLTGKPYENRSDCIKAIRELFALAKLGFHYRMSKHHEKFYYQVMNKQNKVVATSVLYHTMPGMAFGMNAAMKNVCVAVIEDFRHHYC